MNDEVEIKVWSRRGGMLVNTYALDITDAEHPYNQVVAQGKRPEDYGIQHPYEEEFGDKSRTQLIEEIISLRREIEAWVRADAAGLLTKRNY